MGDACQIVVDELASLEEASPIARRVVEELVRKNVIEEAVTDCTLGPDGGHPPHSQIGQYLRTLHRGFLSLKVNGLEVQVGRNIQLPLPFWDTTACPSCGEVTEDPGEGWGPAADDWSQGGDGLLSCQGCHAVTPVARWVCEPPCGFGNLAFTFWNWPSFEAEHWTVTPLQLVEAVVGHTCRHVSGKL